MTFLGSLSNGVIQERANIILKDAIGETFACKVTNQGGEPDSTKLEGTRFSDVLYGTIIQYETAEMKR